MAKKIVFDYVSQHLHAWFIKVIHCGLRDDSGSLSCDIRVCDSRVSRHISINHVFTAHCRWSAAKITDKVNPELIYQVHYREENNKPHVMMPICTTSEEITKMLTFLYFPMYTLNLAVYQTNISIYNYWNIRNICELHKIQINKQAASSDLDKTNKVTPTPTGGHFTAPVSSLVNDTSDGLLPAWNAT